MYFVGLDVHFKRSSLCILDGNGKLVKRLEVKGPWQRMLQVVDEQVPKPFTVVVENVQRRRPLVDVQPDVVHRLG